MPSAHNLSLKRKIALTALKMAGSSPWKKLTVQKIAKQAKIPEEKALNLFPTTEYIIPEIVKIIDDEFSKAATKINPRNSLHDILFESFMSRYDALQSHRPGILEISSACRDSPRMTKLLLLSQWKSIRKILKLARIEQHGISGIIQETVFMSLYLLILNCWTDDTSPDLSKTMSKLDSYLRSSHKIIEILFKQN